MDYHFRNITNEILQFLHSTIRRCQALAFLCFKTLISIQLLISGHALVKLRSVKGTRPIRRKLSVPLLACLG